MDKYDHKKIEQKWQKEWADKKLYETPDSKAGAKNYYQLVEFAYPSGNLHVGHWYAFSMPDMYVRYRRMNGYNTLFPFGFDSFGLPAENAAIKRKLNPRDWTHQNIDAMRTQLRSMGASFDWSREVVTSDPEYYKWTQWLFLKLFEKGLAYQAETAVNWCPSCKTVLANEQVIAGHCERCDNEVEQRHMKQWLLKITDYADRLIDDLENLEWPEPIKEAQRQWIGRSEGSLLQFPISNSQFSIDVFTTRPDTLFGATYLVLAPENPWLAQEIKNQKSKIKNKEEVVRYIEESRKKTELERQENKEKTGVELKGVKAINPGSGEKIPVWVADYVLASYGAGAIMAVPAHDERDYEFARRFALPITEVVSSSDGVYTGEGELRNSGKFDGMSTEEAREAITKEVGGEMKTTYRLRDWLVSRQRYWGAPIPLIFCKKCVELAKSKIKNEKSKSVGEKENPGWVAVDEKELPVELPDLDDFLPTGDGKSPLAKASDWVNVKCPKCDGDAKRETDTFDTFVDSSWYFLRYLDPHNKKEFASRTRQDKWMPIDRYSGGAEHTTMHLLYSRFWHKALFDMGLVGDNEPYRTRLNRGIVLGPDGQKMSKRWGNVVDPDTEVEKYGADTVRMYLAFIGPYNEIGAYPWDQNGITGVRRFLERVWRAASKRLESESVSDFVLHGAIKEVTESLERFKFNTGVSALMKLLNEIEASGISKDQMIVFTKLLAPFAPHIAEEIWREVLGNDTSIHTEEWPKYDEHMLQKGDVIMVVQIDGKVRAEFTVSRDASEDEVKKQALGLKQVQKWLDGVEPKRVIYVRGRLLSIVT